MTDITNDNASTTNPTNNNICQRSGFKVLPGTLVNDEGLWVRPESYDGPNPLDRTLSPRPEQARGSVSPEQTDVFVSDLYPSGVQPSDL